MKHVDLVRNGNMFLTGNVKQSQTCKHGTNMIRFMLEKDCSERRIKKSKSLQNEDRDFTFRK